MALSYEPDGTVRADVMAQLDYMEKRGSGLKRICNETKALESYKEERRPVFKSSPNQFMTVIYSVDYNITGKDTGKDIGKDTSKDTSRDASKDTKAPNRPDIYVLKLINTVGDKTLTVKDMMERIGLKGSDNFRKRYLNPAIEGGYMALLYPENKTNKGQAYYLTELGKQLIEK